jgi:hypothetical protein
MTEEYTLRYLENLPHDQLVTAHDKTKAALLSNNILMHNYRHFKNSL